VALSIISVVGAAALSLALSARGVFEQDQQRTTINQNLRSGVDLLGIDVRQAGERLPGNAPAIEIINGASNAPDELLVRRNLLDFVLPVCKNVNSTSAADAVFIAKKGGGSVPPGCSPVPDANADGWPDNLGAWRDYRLTHGGSVLAFIYNPVTKEASSSRTTMRTSRIFTFTGSTPKTGITTTRGATAAYLHHRAEAVPLDGGRLAVRLQRGYGAPVQPGQPPRKLFKPGPCSTTGPRWTRCRRRRTGRGFNPSRSGSWV
jgi:Tfp pilus assembly protein PilW